jgi:hypothetical protein
MYLWLKQGIINAMMMLSEKSKMASQEAATRKSSVDVLVEARARLGTLNIW